ncbi:hypothetical protein BV20DRAFT_383614 [Pilatotrama ljubarskyi]|nr:hypothetical protein BV20DRAFT_383614 [Pilatotrama ljubarskyi]
MVGMWSGGKALLTVANDEGDGRDECHDSRERDAVVVVQCQESRAVAGVATITGASPRLALPRSFRPSTLPSAVHTSRLDSRRRSCTSSTDVLLYSHPSDKFLWGNGDWGGGQIFQHIEAICANFSAGSPLASTQAACVCVVARAQWKMSKSSSTTDRTTTTRAAKRCSITRMCHNGRKAAIVFQPF